MDNENKKIVMYDQYCPTCKYEDVVETEDPCNECLNIPARDNTRVPEYWEEK